MSQGSNREINGPMNRQRASSGRNTLSTRRTQDLLQTMFASGQQMIANKTQDAAQADSKGILNFSADMLEQFLFINLIGAGKHILVMRTLKLFNHLLEPLALLRGL